MAGDEVVLVVGNLWCCDACTSARSWRQLVELGLHDDTHGAVTMSRRARVRRRCWYCSAKKPMVACVLPDDEMMSGLSLGKFRSCFSVLGKFTLSGIRLLICSFLRYRHPNATMSSPTSSSTTSTNKRKANALGDSDPAGSGGGGRPAVIARLKDATSISDNPSSPTTTTPHIPPPVWGRVLDFMPYEEVRSALLVGKIIANEAVKYVRVLNFMKSCQLDGPSARRFASVEEVNCLSLISGQWSSRVLCSDTTTRLVPLLTIFSKLKRIYVGGLVTENFGDDRDLLFRGSYHPSTCSSPDNHRELAKAFVHSFLGAFKARMLPSSLVKTSILTSCFKYLSGLCSSRNDDGDYIDSNGMCATCRDVCSYFPLEEIMGDPRFSSCAEDIDVCEMISKRKGAREIFRKDSGRRLPNFVDDLFKGFTVKEEALSDRLEDFGMSCGDKNIWYLRMADINELDRLIVLGFDPRAVSKGILYEGLSIGYDDRRYDVLAKSTIDALVARGFAFDEADIIVLDERMEPALKDLPALIRGETGD